MQRCEEMASETYVQLNKEWKATCRIVLGGEVGELDEYAEWLSSLNDKFFTRKSSLSGKEVVFGSDAYCKGAKIISFDEADFTKKFTPLSINEIKDIDSVLSAIQERVFYCGNIVLGNSKFIEKSTSVTDSFYVYRSVKVSGSKNIAYSQYLRLCENVFGTNEGGSSQFCMRGSALFNNARGFELWISGNCSDCHYAYGLDGCRDCMFSFNIVGKTNAIGNLALPKDKYAAIKKKLLQEMRSGLVKGKKLPSLMEIVSQCSDRKGEVASLLKGKLKAPSGLQDMRKIEQGFSETSKVVLGRVLSGIDRYAAWLSHVNPVPYPAASAISGTRVMFADYPCIQSLPKDRLLTQEEALALGESARISGEEAEKFSLDAAHQFLGKVAYFPPERRFEGNRNLIDCSWAANATDNYKVIVAGMCKHCAYCTWPRSSDHLVGCGMVYDSEFSMRCHDSVALKRCFEVDLGRGCSDTYFSHNVESTQDAMFCFNTKNLRHAIGNAELDVSAYRKVKQHILSQLSDELEKKKSLPISIFNAGCRK